MEHNAKAHVPTFTWSEKKTAAGAFRDHFVHVAGLQVDGGDAGLTVTLHDGADATGPVIMELEAPAGEITSDYLGGVPFAAGKVFAAFDGGAGGSAGYRVGVA